MSDLVRIVAPHFVAGVVLGQRCAPVVHYMRFWRYEKIARYCQGKRWACETIR